MLDEFRQGEAGFFLDAGEAVGVEMGGELGVDEVTLGSGRGAGGEAGGGIDEERGADDDEDIGSLRQRHGAFHFRDGFAEPNDVWAQLAAKFTGVAKSNVATFERIEK